MSKELNHLAAILHVYAGGLKDFSHLSTRKGFRSSRKGFVNQFLGKLLNIPGKFSLHKYPGKGKGKERFQSFRVLAFWFPQLTSKKTVLISFMSS